MCIYSNVIIVLVAPEITIPPVDTVVINGSDAMLNCTVVGDPRPSISWSVSEVDISLLLANNVTIPFNAQGMINNALVDNMILNSTTMYSSLRFPETASFIAGNYTCRASNVLENINRTAVLTVHGMYILDVNCKEVYFIESVKHNKTLSKSMLVCNLEQYIALVNNFKQ